MAAEVRAADLPEGSIIAARKYVLIKEKAHVWQSTMGHAWSNGAVDMLLDEGAPVLRHGYGEDPP